MDQQALNLAKAIRRTETGGHKDPYNARGASGEFGAFQFMPATYKVLAQKHLGDANAAPTVENQNKIVYSEVKSLKDQGYNPAQIASIWNSGKPDKYKSGGIGVNKYGVNYNVPDYVKKVSQAYRDISGRSQPQVEQPVAEQTIPQQRQELQAQGEPVSVNEFKAQPTGVGKFIRGALKPFASAATTLTPAYRELKSVVQGQGVPDYQDLYAPVKSKYLGDIYSPGAKGIVKLNQAQNVGDVAKGALQATTDIAGKGLEIGSYAMGGGEVAQGLKTLPTIGKAALEGAKIGFTGGLGTGLQSASEQTNVGQALKDVAFQAGGGALAGGVLGGATTGLIKGVSGIKNVIKPSEKAVSDAINSLEKTYTDISTGTLTGKKNLNKILSKTESMNKAGTEGVTPMRKLAEDGIVPSTKGTKLDTFQQAQDYRAKVEPLYEVNKKALQEVGLSTAPVQLDDLERGAIEYAKTPENINSGRFAKMASEIKSEFNLLRENYPDGVVPLNIVDDIKSARWSNVFKNKGFIESDILKKDSEYAIAKSLQKTIEKIAEDAGHADVAQLNREIGSILDASKFLESLDGKTLKGGRVGKYVGTLIGSTIGNSLPAKIVGALGGNVVADILIKSDVQSPVRRLILSKLEQSSPKAYEATLKWLAEQDALRMTRLQLPAPKNVGPIVNQGRPIQVAPTGSTAEYLGKDVVAQSKSPLNQQTVAATNNVTNTSISTELPKPKVKSSDLSIGKKSLPKVNKVVNKNSDVIKSVGNNKFTIKSPERIYNKGTRITGEYGGKEYVTNGFILEFSNDSNLIHDFAKTPKGPDSNAIQTLINKSKDGAKDIGKPVSMGDSAGDKVFIFKDGTSVNPDYYNYFVNKYDNVKFEHRDGGAIMVSSNDKMVGLLMPYNKVVENKNIIPIENVVKPKRIISEESYKKALKNLGDTSTLNSTPIHLSKDALIVAGYHIENGVRSAAELGIELAKKGYKFTKEQLEELFNKANKNIEIEPLIQEAKKYKSAEEFVREVNNNFDKYRSDINKLGNTDVGYLREIWEKANPKAKVEPRVNLDIMEKIQKAGKREYNVAVKEVQQASGEKMINGYIEIGKLNPTQNMYDLTNIAEYKKLVQGKEVAPIVVDYNGKTFDIYDGHNRLKAYKELGVKKVPITVNESAKSQLTDIWNKANKKGLPKNTKLIRNKDGSIIYGSQKMSGDFKDMSDKEIIKMFNNTPF